MIANIASKLLTKSVAKVAVEFIAGASVGAVIENAIKATTPTNLKRVDKISVKIGTYVISGMLSSIGADWAVKKVFPAKKQRKPVKRLYKRNRN